MTRTRVALLLALGPVGVTTCFFASCSDGSKTAPVATVPPAPGRTTSTNDVVVSSRSLGQAPATPFAKEGGTLRSTNTVRTVSVAGDSVEGQWGNRRGPSTSTSRLLLGGNAVEHAGEWTTAGNAASRSGGGVEERIEPTSGGYQRTWTFQSAPPGDIVASIGVSADAALSWDSKGLHVMREGGGFRIGNATWVDASGKRTPIGSTYSQGELTYRVPAALVASSAFPAVLDPIVSAEFLAPPSQNTHQWIFTNDSYAAPSFNGLFTRPGGGLGAVLAPYTTNNGNSYWSGNKYLLDLFDVSPTSTTGLNLIKSTPFPWPPPSTTSVTYLSQPVSAPCGTDECVTVAYLSGSSIYLQRLDATTGTWLDTSGTVVTDSVNDTVYVYGYPSLWSNGTQYFVCWPDQSNTTTHEIHCTARNVSDLSLAASSMVFNP
ncbi:MAG: hypothetical protein ACREOE_03395, partial [Gemmatimonadales bacterium]